MRSRLEGNTQDLIPEAVEKLRYISIVTMDKESLEECKELMTILESDTKTKEDIEVTLNYINNEYAKYTD